MNGEQKFAAGGIVTGGDTTIRITRAGHCMHGVAIVVIDHVPQRLYTAEQVRNGRVPCPCERAPS